MLCNYASRSRADLLETAEESCDKAERSFGMLDSRPGKSQKRDEKAMNEAGRSATEFAKRTHDMAASRR